MKRLIELRKTGWELGPVERHAFEHETGPRAGAAPDPAAAPARGDGLLGGPADVQVGMVLGGRYRLEATSTAWG